MDSLQVKTTEQAEKTPKMVLELERGMKENHQRNILYLIPLSHFKYFAFPRVHPRLCLSKKYIFMSASFLVVIDYIDYYLYISQHCLWPLQLHAYEDDGLDPLPTRDVCLPDRKSVV